MPINQSIFDTWLWSSYLIIAQFFFKLLLFGIVIKQHFLFTVYETESCFCQSQNWINNIVARKIDRSKILPLAVSQYHGYSSISFYISHKMFSTTDMTKKWIMINHISVISVILNIAWDILQEIEEYPCYCYISNGKILLLSIYLATILLIPFWLSQKQLSVS
jgi:hypothetical protein